MPKSKSRKKKSPKRILAFPDLEHAKTAVLNSLTSPAASEPTTTPFASSSLGTARNRAGVQPDGGAPLPHSSRTTRVCTGHDQSSASGSPSRCV